MIRKILYLLFFPKVYEKSILRNPRGTFLFIAAYPALALHYILFLFIPQIRIGLFISACAITAGMLWLTRTVSIEDIIILCQYLVGKEKKFWKLTTSPA